MIEASSEELLSATPEVAFDFVANPANEQKWNPDALSWESVTPGPVGLGSKRRSDYKHVGQVDTEIVTYERPHRLTLHSVGRQADMTLEFVFAPADGGTRMLVTGHLQLRGPLRFAEGVLRHQVVGQYAARAALIKRHLDGAAS